VSEGALRSAPTVRQVSEAALQFAPTVRHASVRALCGPRAV